MKLLELASSSSYSYSTSTSGSGSESDSCKKKEKKEKKEEKKMCESSESEERVEPENFKAMKASPDYMEIDAEEEEDHPEPAKVVLSEAPRVAGDRNKAPPEGAPEKVPCVYCGKYISDTPNARWQHEVYGTCKKRRVAYARDWEKGDEPGSSSTGHKDPWASRHAGGGEKWEEKQKGWQPQRGSSHRSRSPLARLRRPTPPPGPPPSAKAKAEASRGPQGSRPQTQDVNDVLANFMMSMGQVLKLGSDVNATPP